MNNHYKFEDFNQEEDEITFDGCIDGGNCGMIPVRMDLPYILMLKVNSIINQMIYDYESQGSRIPSIEKLFFQSWLEISRRSHGNECLIVIIIYDKSNPTFEAFQMERRVAIYPNDILYPFFKEYYMDALEKYFFE